LYVAREQFLFANRGQSWDTLLTWSVVAIARSWPYAFQGGVMFSLRLSRTTIGLVLFAALVVIVLLLSSVRVAGVM
jgi:hypothetical protein